MDIYPLEKKKKKSSHPLQKCLKNGNNIIICTSLIQTMMLMYIVIILIVWYLENKPAIDSISKFPWVNATNDAEKFYLSIRTYDTRKTLNSATDTVNMVHKMVKKQQQPMDKVSKIIDAAYDDKDVFNHAKKILLKLYKPVEDLEDNQQVVFGVLKHVKTQMDSMEVDEIHKLTKDIISLIAKLEDVLTVANIKTFFDTLNILEDKLNTTDITMINKVIKDTDDTIVKIEQVSNVLNKVLP